MDNPRGLPNKQIFVYGLSYMHIIIVLTGGLSKIFPDNLTFY